MTNQNSESKEIQDTSQDQGHVHVHGPHCNHHHHKLAPIVREMPKVGRNDDCPCGSQKKYKKCCGK